MVRHTLLSLLICNAGVMACPDGHTKDGINTQFGTNHLVHFLYMNLFKNVLIDSSAPEFNPN